MYFEEQNIRTMSADGELMMTILASYAQEESRSASENQKWRIKKNFEEGMPWSGVIIGYRYDHGTFVVVPEEAAVVKRIFSDYLSGMGVQTIMNSLNREGIMTRRGFQWSKTAVLTVLRNYAYTGNLILQKTFRENHITKKKRVNHGEQPQYHVEKSHEAIIPLEQFLAVQEERERRAQKYNGRQMPKSYPFTGMLVCGICGKHYRRRTAPNGHFWICATYNIQGKAACPSKQVPEKALYLAAAEVLGTDCFDEEALRKRIDTVRVEADNTLVFCGKDGSETVKQWKDRSRSEAWTPEMREMARQKTLQRMSLKEESDG